MNEESPTDRQLMEKAQEGDREAFRKIVDRYKQRIVNFLNSLCGDRQRARDLAQEVFIKVYERRQQYSPTGSFSSYLYTIARNHWYDYLRSTKTDLDTMSLDAPAGDPGGDSIGSLIENQSASEPFEELREEEKKDILHRALQELDEKHREVVILSHLEQKPHADIADILNIPVGTVKSRKYKAIRKLRDIVNRWNQEKEA